VKTTIQENFYRSGQLRERVPIRNGRRHGVIRTWHNNGALATEEHYRCGFLHGLCRQWDEHGKLLGEYKMDRGTGIQRSWYDNGQLQSEVSTVAGEFCGRNRLWLRDGTLLSERFYLFGRVVGAETYRAAADKETTLPRFRSRSAKPLPKNRTTERRIHQLFVSSLVRRRNGLEVRRWLHKKPGEKAGRSLGRFKPAHDAAKCDTGKFVSQLYEAGAKAVIVPDIYRGKDGTQFADALVVQLPKDPTKRRAIRKVCSQLKERELGAIEPSTDIGETHLYLSLA
jgi:hypothetical protein